MDILPPQTTTLKIPTKDLNGFNLKSSLTTSKIFSPNLTEMLHEEEISRGVFTTDTLYPLFISIFAKYKVSFLDLNTAIAYCIIPPIICTKLPSLHYIVYIKESLLMIYLDNSASTFVKPKEVIKAVNDALVHYTANPGRSGHNASIKTALKIEEAREKVASHFNAESGQNVIWTHNCSQALNLAILGSAKKGGHVVATENEHNSVLRPLEHLKSQGIIDYSIASQTKEMGITLDDIKKEVRPNTYMIVCNHISNVNGDKADIKTIGKYCKENNIIFLVDGAQSCGHTKIDIKENNIDYLTVAGHKGFYAPQSIGCLVMNDKYRPEPILFGGTGTNSLELVQPDIFPERLESGTISTPLILGLSAGIDFVENNFQEINNKIDDLTTYLNYELSKINIKIYTQPENAFGVFAFNIANHDSGEIANTLNSKYSICVRGGFHCAPLKHKALGTLEQGAIRVSLSYFNSFSEIQKLIHAIKHIAKQKD